MSVKIRLRRMGRKKQAHYRIVVADSAAPRDGRFVETLGYYKPLTAPARLVVDMDKADAWIAKGAEPSDTVRTLLNKARRGGDDTVALGELDPEEAKALRAAALEERRKGEIKAREEAVAAEAAQVAAAAAAAEVEAAEAAAAAAVEAEEEAEPEAEAAEEEAPEAEAAEEEAEPEAEAAEEEAPEAEASEEPAAEEEAEPEAEVEATEEEAPETEAAAEPAAEAEEETKESE